MPGKRLTDQQAKLYMDYRRKNFNQATAAAKAGISERSGRRIEAKQSCIQKDKALRHWRTRKDPLEPVWDSELKPMLENEPLLTADGLWEYLNDNYPNEYGRKIRRTLQRRVKAWKACYGRGKDVIFRQSHEPGRLGISDFTHLKGVTISIKGQPLEHILYHYRLVFSGWRHIKVIVGGESFEALSTGLQEALTLCGGVPQEHRTDSLSAAYTNHCEKMQLTKRYQELCEHYQLTASKNNPGKSHENGAIESPHGHFKRKLEQALLTRGSTDFVSIEAYQSFINQIVSKLNSRCSDLLAQEQAHLNQLPSHKSPEFDQVRTVVSSSSTIVIKRVTYSVPSRLRGERVCVHVFDDKIEVYVGATLAFTTQRIRTNAGRRARCIDYRHVIGSLVKKPQAFRYSQLREDLIPSTDYKMIWCYVDKVLDPRQACRYFVRTLWLAAQHDCEEALGRYILQSIQQQGCLPSEEICHSRFVPSYGVYPQIESMQHDLADYDQLIENSWGVHNA